MRVGWRESAVAQFGEDLVARDAQPQLAFGVLELVRLAVGERVGPVDADTPGHGLQGKQNLYEHTWRVPMIAMGPGIEKNLRTQGNVYLLDLLGTLCELTGVAAPDSNEGRSFAPVLNGTASTIRDVLYGTYSGGTKPGIRCVKKGDWKLIKYDVIDGRVRETQLFNLAENPEEFLVEHQDIAVTRLVGSAPTSNQVNLALEPAYTDKLEEMEDLLQSEMRRLDDPYVLWDQQRKKKK